MAFDSTDYFRAEPAKVYDKDNPPARMSEAIRMAVADVEAQERAGIEYDWFDCATCTAGAVVRHLGGKRWDDFGPKWEALFECLSFISMSWGGYSLDGDIFSGNEREFWDDAGFGQVPKNVLVTMTPYGANPAAFKRDMLNLADRLEAEGS